MVRYEYLAPGDADWTRVSIPVGSKKGAEDMQALVAKQKITPIRNMLIEQIGAWEPGDPE